MNGTRTMSAARVAVATLFLWAACFPVSATRALEPLERFDLDSLEFGPVSTDECGTRVSIRDPDGYVHSIRVGSFIGKDNGRVRAISKSEIRLTEVVQDEKGQWIERNRSIPISAEDPSGPDLAP